MFQVSNCLRSLLRLGRTGIAVLLLLVLGISVSLAVFCVMDATFLRPLPFPRPSALVALDDQTAGNSLGVSWGEVQQWEQAPGLFDGAAAFSRRTWALTDHTGADLQVVLSGMVTPGFFGVLQQRPALGTLLPAAEGGDPHVAVLSYGLWQSRYGGRTSVLGSVIALNDVPYRVLGVLPKSFSFPIDGAVPQIYIPLGPGYCCLLNQRGLSGIARLAPGITIAAANEELAAMAQRTAASEGWPRFTSRALPLQVFATRDARRSVRLLWLSVLAVTLIASLNAGALLVARSLRDLRQYALKLSFGARLRDLAREQTVLALTMGILAGAASLPVSFALLHGVRLSAVFRDLPGPMPSLNALWDWRVFSFCVLLSLGASLAACLLPLTLLGGISVERLLRSRSGLSSSRTGHRVRTVLITAQLALSVLLLSAVFSLGHSLYSVLRRSPGFQTRHIVMAGIGIPDARYNTDAKMIGFHEQALVSIRAIPGVQAAGFAGGAPIHPLTTRFVLDGSPAGALPVAQRPRVNIALVSPSMFRVLGVPLLRGRGFDSSDRLGAPYAVIVNQSFARRYLDAADPLHRGMRVQFYNGFAMKPWTHFNIIGIVADSRSVSLDRPPAPEIYLSTEQVAIEGGDYFLDTTRPASSLAEELPAAIWRIDSTVQKVQPMELQLYLDDGFSSREAALDLSFGFAAIALLLAAIGLGAGISAAVFESRREIGIRAALGESRQSLAARVVRLALLRTLLGTACGVAGAIAFSRVVTLSLDPQATIDVWVLPVVPVVMTVTAGLASALPVRRALGISPLEVLRSD